MQSPQLKRALISVSDKDGLAELAQGLIAAGVEIYSTGGTARHLQEKGIAVVEISAYTSFPEMMDGRLKTLHPKVFGGILGRHDRTDDLDSMEQHGINSFELVVVNLYPFESTVARPNTSFEQAIEQIDIGGPSLVRAAAKNHAFVTIATRPEQYQEILQEFSAAGATSPELRRRLAAEAFARTAAYDRAIAAYFAEQAEPDGLPATIGPVLQRKAVLRYGENPHQPAALYAPPQVQPDTLVAAKQLNGKELSYNNYLDLDSALCIVRSFAGPCATVMKHNNPCGVAMAETLAEATQRALEGDPVSAFGSVLGLNRVVDPATAEVLCAPGLFIEAIVAPAFDAEALQMLTSRPKWKSNVRLMEIGRMAEPDSAIGLRQIDGGFLAQAADLGADAEGPWHVATASQPTEQQQAELRFAWQVVRHVKSNAIVLTRDQALCGAGAGQMSRVDSVEIAITKAGGCGKGAVLASDAFFPFPDSIHRAAEAGIAAIIQPGGSKRDNEVIEACNEHGLPMILTGRRHFKH